MNVARGCVGLSESDVDVCGVGSLVVAYVDIGIVDVWCLVSHVMWCLFVSDVDDGVVGDVVGALCVGLSSELVGKQTSAV